MGRGHGRGSSAAQQLDCVALTAVSCCPAETYTDVVGDHPSNMVSTSLGLNAFALTGEHEFKDWVLEYVDAWIDRAAANPVPGVLPSNVGLDGTIGGAADGKWCARGAAPSSGCQLSPQLLPRHLETASPP